MLQGKTQLSTLKESFDCVCFSYCIAIAKFKVVIYQTTNHSDSDNIVHVFNSLDIAIQCSKPTGWHETDDEYSLQPKETKHLTWTCKKY